MFTIPQVIVFIKFDFFVLFMKEQNIRMDSSQSYDMSRAESLAKDAFKNKRNPLDTAGMDSDDEEWIYENPDYADYIMDFYNDLVAKKKKNKKKENLDPIKQ